LAEEALSSVSQKLVDAHEQERTWLARELHDDINQRLSLLAVSVDALKEGLPNSALASMRQTDEVSKEISNILDEIQALSHRLHTSKLDILGLGAAAL
jgi:signal transduction histidine kinase